MLKQSIKKKEAIYETYISSMAAAEIKDYCEAHSDSPVVRQYDMFRLYYIFSKVYIHKFIAYSYACGHPMGYVINNNKLAKQLKTKVRNVRRLVNFLRDAGILKLELDYSVSNHGRVYSIADRYTKDTSIEIWGLDNKVSSHVLHESAQLGLSSKFFSKYYSILKRVSIASPEEILADDSECILDPSAISTIGIINSSMPYFIQPAENSRIYHPICNIKKGLRKYLTFDNKTSNLRDSFYQIDLVSSQVVLGALKYLDFYKITLQEAPEDFKAFYKCAVEGKFYETLAGYTTSPDRKRPQKMTKDERSTFKVRFFSNIYFSKPYPVDENSVTIAGRFKKIYPTMYEFINMFKTKDLTSDTIKGIEGIDKKDLFKQWCMSLQRFEYDIFMEALKSCYRDSIDAISLHDSIVYFDKNQGDAILEKVKEIFKTKYNCTPSLKKSRF